MIVEIEVGTLSEATALRVLFPGSQVRDSSAFETAPTPVEDLTPGEALIRIRANIGITQSELADASGVTTRTISSFERGALWPRAVTLFKLERALGLCPGYFLDLAKARPGH
ncbi:helix-turn-helix transcriptional regulator [Brevibacterium casei]|uniref:helix-turn-helix transcriptional regulator n=1 Tax=Brevibacterium casei TaxID=33889 RepID=UPI00167C9F7A|nr:helix-turn-helix transcriptional regulator [Brevibacterium casei]